MHGYAPRREQIHQHARHVLGCDAPLHLQGRALAGELVHHAQPLQGTPTLVGVVDEVDRPHVVLVLSLAADHAVLRMPEIPAFVHREIRHRAGRGHVENFWR